MVPLPFPRPVVWEGERLPASNANFYIATGVVIVPTFNDRNDRVALNTLSDSMLFPNVHTPERLMRQVQDQARWKLAG